MIILPKIILTAGALLALANTIAGENNIAQSAKIDPSADIGKEVSIGKSSIIGRNVHIGDHVTIKQFDLIRPHVTILKSTSIGKHTIVDQGTEIGTGAVIKSHVYVGKHLKIGNGVRINANAIVHANIPDHKKLGKNNIAISAISSESLLTALKDYNYQENVMHSVITRTDESFDNYMLTGLQNVLTLFGKQCKAYLDRNGFDDFKFLIAAYFRRRMKVNAKQLQDYIYNGAHNFPELKPSHFGNLDCKQSKQKLQIIRKFRMAWAIYMEAILRQNENQLPLRDYCDIVSKIASKQSRIKMFDDEKTLFVF